jgi:hypothetical protein
MIGTILVVRIEDGGSIFVYLMESDNNNKQHSIAGKGKRMWNVFAFLLFRLHTVFPFVHSFDGIRFPEWMEVGRIDRKVFCIGSYKMGK